MSPLISIGRRRRVRVAIERNTDEGTLFRQPVAAVGVKRHTEEGISDAGSAGDPELRPAAAARRDEGFKARDQARERARVGASDLATGQSDVVAQYVLGVVVEQAENVTDRTGTDPVVAADAIEYGQCIVAITSGRDIVVSDNERQSAVLLIIKLKPNQRSARIGHIVVESRAENRFGRGRANRSCTGERARNA